jgi:hypothetical protein
MVLTKLIEEMVGLKCSSCKWWSSKNAKIGLCNSRDMRGSFWSPPTFKEDLKRTVSDFGCRFWEERDATKTD